MSQKWELACYGIDTGIISNRLLDDAAQGTCMVDKQTTPLRKQKSYVLELLP